MDYDTEPVGGARSHGTTRKSCNVDSVLCRAEGTQNVECCLLLLPSATLTPPLVFNFELTFYLYYY